MGTGWKPVLVKLENDRGTAFMPTNSAFALKEKPVLPVMLQAFDPEGEFEIRHRNLPHWRQQGATYFVTFRLNDSLPQAKLAQLAPNANNG